LDLRTSAGRTAFKRNGKETDLEEIARRAGNGKEESIEAGYFEVMIHGIGGGG